MLMITLLCLLLALLLILFLCLPPPPVPPSPSDSTQFPTRHVSFSLVSSETSYTLPLSPSPTRRWSSSSHKRKPSAPDPPGPPQPQNPPIPVDQFGPLPPSAPAPFDMHLSPMSPRRLPTLRLSLTGKRRSASVSWTSTSIRLDQLDSRAPSPPPSSPLSQRTRFVNPFRKHSRSRTLSPPSISKSLEASPNPFSTSSPSPLPLGRRSLVNKLKSVFKSISPEPSPVIHSKPIVKTINNRLRRKPVARTQPYGPPWNAPMPVPDFSLSQHSLQKHAETMSPSSYTSHKRSVNESSLFEKAPTSPSQLSPRTFVSELDDRLSLLRQQRIQDLIPSPHD